MTKTKPEKCGSPKMRERAEIRIALEVKQLLKAMKTKQAIAEYAVMQQFEVKREMFLLAIAFSLFTPEQNRKYLRKAKTVTPDANYISLLKELGKSKKD